MLETRASHTHMQSKAIHTDTMWTGRQTLLLSDWVHYEEWSHWNETFQTLRHKNHMRIPITSFQLLEAPCFLRAQRRRSTVRQELKKCQLGAERSASSGRFQPCSWRVKAPWWTQPHIAARNWKDAIVLSNTTELASHTRTQTAFMHILYGYCLTLKKRSKWQRKWMQMCHWLSYKTEWTALLSVFLHRLEGGIVSESNPWKCFIRNTRHREHQCIILTVTWITTLGLKLRI